MHYRSHNAALQFSAEIEWWHHFVFDSLALKSWSCVPQPDQNHVLPHRPFCFVLIEGTLTPVCRSGGSVLNVLTILLLYKLSQSKLKALLLLTTAAVHIPELLETCLHEPTST